MLEWAASRPRPRTMTAPGSECCVPSEPVVLYLSGSGVRRGRGASGVPSLHEFELFSASGISPVGLRPRAQASSALAFEASSTPSPGTISIGYRYRTVELVGLQVGREWGSYHSRLAFDWSHSPSLPAENRLKLPSPHNVHPVFQCNLILPVMAGISLRNCATLDSLPGMNRRRRK